MADVQTEHGHLRIANALWEAWTIADLTAAELRVLFALVRLSYGWGRKETAMRGTKPRPASAATLQRMTGLDPKGVRRAVKGLCMKQVVRRVTEHDSEAGEAAVYAPNKDFDSWSPGVLPGTWEPSKQDPTPGQDTPGYAAPSPPGKLPPPPPGTVPPPPPGKLPPPYKDKGERQNEKTERETEERPVSPAAVSVAADVLEVYAAFREIVPSSRATPTKGRVNDIKVLLREHTVAELVTMLRWAGKSDGYKYQRENGYLRWSSLLGKDGRGKVMDRIEAALSWSEGGGFTDSPDDYELPPDFDAVEIRGSWVHRAADGTWYPATKQFTNPRLPWRAELARVATARIDAKGTDLYPPADYLAAVKGSRFPADVRDPWVLQMAIDDVVNDIREERGLI